MYSSRHIGNLAAALLTLVLYLAPHYHCMPVTTPDDISHGWWHTPCGPGEEMTTTRPVGSGGQMKSFRRTKTQLQLTHDHYKGLQLDDMYSQKVGPIDYDSDWLPIKQLEWFNREFGRIDSNIKDMAPKVLHKLHKNLQKFAVTLDKLYRHVHAERHSNFDKTRTKVLLQLCHELKRLLCEVEESLATAGQKRPSPPADDSFIPADKWDTREDSTAVLIQDWGVLKPYGEFLLDWKLIVDKLLESSSGSKRRKLRRKGQNKNRKRPNGNRKGNTGPSSSQEEQRSRAESGAEESTEAPAGVVRKVRGDGANRGATRRGKKGPQMGRRGGAARRATTVEVME